MNEIELTKLFVEYSELASKMTALKAQIESEVLGRGETVKIAGVTATYYKPSTETPDYQSAAEAKRRSWPVNFNLASYQTITISTKWKEVCEALRIAAAPGAEKPARVVVKV